MQASRNVPTTTWIRLRHSLTVTHPCQFVICTSKFKFKFRVHEREWCETEFKIPNITPRQTERERERRRQMKKRRNETLKNWIEWWLGVGTQPKMENNKSTRVMQWLVLCYRSVRTPRLIKRFRHSAMRHNHNTNRLAANYSLMEIVSKERMKKDILLRLPTSKLPPDRNGSPTLSSDPEYVTPNKSTEMGKTIARAHTQWRRRILWWTMMNDEDKGSHNSYN